MWGSGVPEVCGGWEKRGITAGNEENILTTAQGETGESLLTSAPSCCCAWSSAPHSRACASEGRGHKTTQSKSGQGREWKIPDGVAGNSTEQSKNSSHLHWIHREGTEGAPSMEAQQSPNSSASCSSPSSLFVGLCPSDHGLVLS